MKKLGLFLAAATLAVVGFSQSSRQTISLKNVDWRISTESSIGSSAFIYSKSIVFDSKGTTLIDTSAFLIGEISIDEEFPNLIAFYNYGTENNFDIHINNNKVKNELDGTNFYAEITPFVLPGVNYIVFKPRHLMMCSELLATVKYSQIAMLGGMVFTKFEVKKDTYFGGNLLLVKVKNFNENDLDGKIYARLYTTDTLNLLSESNNCAFSRSGEESSIEINFPELKTDLTGQRIIVELTIVDKEKNEEVIDQLTLPVIY